MDKEISLPLDGIELAIVPSERGYRFILRQEGYEDTQVFTLSEFACNFHGTLLRQLEISIDRDYDDPACAYRTSLLDPGGRPCVIQRDGGPYSLYCAKCRCWIPSTANNEMRKEGVYSHSHICGIKGPDEIYEDKQIDGM